MVRKKVWALPKVKVVWMRLPCSQAFGRSQRRRAALRALLGLPGPQLKEVASVAKDSLSKFLKLLSATEKADVLSGRWAGVEQSEPDKVKAEIVKSLEKM